MKRILITALFIIFTVGLINAQQSSTEDLSIAAANPLAELKPFRSSQSPEGFFIKNHLELRNILEFFNNRNGNTNYSLKLLDEIEDLLNTLSQSEFIGRLTPNKKTRVVVKFQIISSRITSEECLWYK